MSELIALKSESRSSSILDLQVDMTVCYGNPSEGDVMYTDKLMGVQFTEEPNDIKQGDMSTEHTLPFIFLRKLPG